MTARSGILAAGTLLVDHVQRITHWPDQGWLTEIVARERCSGGAVPNVLLTLARMQSGLPLAAAGITGEDADGDYLLQRLREEGVDCRGVTRTRAAATAMTQVMTAPDGQRTFFHARGASALLDVAHFRDLTTPHRIFHLGYLLLLDQLDRPDAQFGTRSARLLAQMQQRGYLTSLDLVSRAGDHRSLVLPALRWLDYLIINELEAAALTGIPLRHGAGLASPETFAAAGAWLLQQGVRQRVVIHAPEGAWCSRNVSDIARQNAKACGTAKLSRFIGQQGKRLRSSGAMHHNRASFWFRLFLTGCATENVNDCAGDGTAIAIRTGESGGGTSRPAGSLSATTISC